MSGGGISSSSSDPITRLCLFFLLPFLELVPGLPYMDVKILYDFEVAQMEEAQMEEAQMEEVQMEEAQMEEARWRRSRWRRPRWRRPR